MTALIGRREFITLLGGAAALAAGSACAAIRTHPTHWLAGWDKRFRSRNNNAYCSVSK